MELAAFKVSVKSLAEFVHKRGSLDVRFTPAPTALQGIQGHQYVTQRRPAYYQTEVTLTHSYASLTVKGRCDGYDALSGCVEEIKTHRIDIERIPENHRQLHWAQAKLYAAMLCLRDQLPQLTVCVVYFHITEQQETRHEQRYRADHLIQYFHRSCEAYLQWAESQAERERRRNHELSAWFGPSKVTGPDSTT